jgi:hypothetical protein
MSFLVEIVCHPNSQSQLKEWETSDFLPSFHTLNVVI